MLPTSNTELQEQLDEARKTIGTLEQKLTAASDNAVDPTDEGIIKKPAAQKGKRIRIFESMGPRVNRDLYKAIQVSFIELHTLSSFTTLMVLGHSSVYTT